MMLLQMRVTEGGICTQGEFKAYLGKIKKKLNQRNYILQDQINR